MSKKIPSVNEICTLLIWDSDHFGIPIAKLHISEDITTDQLSHALAWCRSRKIMCLYALVDPYYRSKTIMLAQNRFELIDIRVTLTRHLTERLPKQFKTAHIAKTDFSDRLVLEKLSKKIKWLSRFTLDERFDQKLVSSMYLKWIINSLGKANSVVFVASLNGDEAGVLVCDVHEEVGSISLIGVDNNYTGKGIGKNLLTYGLSWFSQNDRISKVKVVTQACNYPALSLYEGLGFRTSKYQQWYHRWAITNE